MNAIGMPLNRYLTEDPTENCTSLKTKAFVCDLIVKISWIATLAIMGLVIASSYGLLLALPPLVKAGMVLATPALVFGAAQNCAIWGYRYGKQAEIEECVAQELEEIADFNETQFLDHPLPYEIATIGDKEFKRGIARFSYLLEESKRLAARSAEKFHAAKEETVPELRHEKCLSAHADRIEGIMHALDSAIMLQIIEKPFNVALGLHQPDLTVPYLGRYTPPSFIEILEDTYLKSMREREWFVFNPDVRRDRENLAMADIRRRPEALRERLFGPL